MLCDNLSSYYAHVGANMYRACLSEAETYNNGFVVGEVYALTYCSLLSIKEKTTDSTKRSTIEDALSKLNSCNSYQKLDSILTQLKENGVLF